VELELALEIEREIKLEREDQFVLEQVESDQHKQHCSGDKNKV
jgi:hypothetical protein